MPDVMPQYARPARSASLEAPLMVTGTVHGNPVSVLVTGLSDVVAQIGDWTLDDPDAVGAWGLRDDYSEPLMIPVRVPSDVLRERARASHVVRLLPGVRLGAALTALCGERVPLVGADVVPLGAGMPCEPCLAQATMACGSMSFGQLPLFRRIKPELDTRIG